MKIFKEKINEKIKAIKEKKKTHLAKVQTKNTAN